MNVTMPEFEAYFRELHSYQPFPWQSKLAREICATGDWPPINLPTSTGKTAVMDIALFHLAVQADKAPAERKAPRRIFFVVDRRLVVDDAARRAVRIAERLKKAFADPGDSLHAVAKRLEGLAGSGIPLQVLRLRGGVPREPNPFRHPLQPMIILSTVDQTGSRLLFRGYGVSEYARPIHAAMVGSDSLIILDEAHLSQPFLQTLGLVGHYRSDIWSQKPLHTPFAVAVMTATPRVGKVSFTLTKKDKNNPVLKKRLSARKPALLVEIATPKDDPHTQNEQRAGTLAEHARNLMIELMRHFKENTGDPEQPVVGVVVNRVATARKVFEKLRESTDAVLLTGRSRPFDREQLIQQFLPRIQAGRNNAANLAPLFVVATQTVEVGADIDFDALVSEAASLDALRQRFGRLNRLGRHAQAAAVIVHDKTTQKDDPVYGKAIEASWKWLNRIATGPKTAKSVDFGIRSLPDPPGDSLKDLNSPSLDAPVLMPAHVDLLVQTSPAPAVEPDLSTLLHGSEKQSADVQIIWRADLPNNLRRQVEPDITAIIAQVPPRDAETLQLPLWVAQSWLSRRQSIETLSDVESGAADVERTRANEAGRLVFLWRGLDESRLAEVNELRPGDTVVVPTTWGGLDEFGWYPESNKTVIDIADEVSTCATGNAIVRIHPELAAQWFEMNHNAVSELRSRLAVCMRSTMNDEPFIDRATDFLAYLEGSESIKSDFRARLESLEKGYRISVYPASDNSLAAGFFAGARKRRTCDFTDEDESSSFTTALTLDAHVESVAEMAHRFANCAGLTRALASDVEIAARLHDLGKADPRFQALLHGGDRYAARRSGQLLAKSTSQSGSSKAYLNARERAGYPKGARHECYSAAVARGSKSLLQQAHDKELVIYLIGTHHGRGRPFMPASEDDGTTIDLVMGGHTIRFDGQHRLELLDSGWTDSFWVLSRRYGYWGLAFLESLIRLADHRCSEMEEQERND